MRVVRGRFAVAVGVLGALWSAGCSGDGTADVATLPPVTSAASVDGAASSTSVAVSVASSTTETPPVVSDAVTTVGPSSTTSTTTNETSTTSTVVPDGFVGLSPTARGSWWTRRRASTRPVWCTS